MVVAIDFIAEGRPPLALLSREQFKVWAGAKPLDPRVLFIGLSAVFAARGDNQLAHIVRLDRRTTTAPE